MDLADLPSTAGSAASVTSTSSLVVVGPVVAISSGAASAVSGTASPSEVMTSTRADPCTGRLSVRLRTDRVPLVLTEYHSSSALLSQRGSDTHPRADPTTDRRGPSLAESSPVESTHVHPEPASAAGQSRLAVHRSQLLHRRRRDARGSAPVHRDARQRRVGGIRWRHGRIRQNAGWSVEWTREVPLCAR